MELEVAPPTATLPVTVCVTPTWPRLPAAQTLLVTNRVPFEERDLTDPHVVQEAQQLTGIRVLRSSSWAMRSTTARSYLNVPLWSAPWASDAHGSPLCAAALAGFEPRPVRVHCDRWWPRVRCVTLSGTASLYRIEANDPDCSPNAVVPDTPALREAEAASFLRAN